MEPDDLDGNDPEPTNEELDKMEKADKPRRGRPPFKVKEEAKAEPTKRKRRGRRKGWKRKSGLDGTLSNLLAEAQVVINSLTVAHVKVGELHTKLLGDTYSPVEEVESKDNGIFSTLEANLKTMRNLADAIVNMANI